MKVLRVNTTIGQGGAAHSTVNINQAVKKNGVESWMLTARGGADISNQIVSLNETKFRRYCNILVYRILGKDGFFNQNLWQNALKDLDSFDLVHIHNAHGYYMSTSILKKLLKKPCVWTLHDYRLITGGTAFPTSHHKKKSLLEKLFPFVNFGYPSEWIDRSSKRRKKFLQLVLNYNPSLVAVSQTMSRNLYSYGLPEKKNIHVIPHGLFENTLPPDAEDRLKAREKLDWPIDKHIFLFVSAQIDNPVKGFTYFKEALNNLPERDNWIAFVIGNNYENIINKVDFESLKIHFLGRVEQEKMKYYYRACDTYVSSSLDETFGRTVVEAGAEGAEIICTNLSIFHEVTEGRALFFEPANIPDLSDKLLKVLNNPLASRKRWQYAMQTRKIFSRKNMTEKYISLYQHLITTK